MRKKEGARCGKERVISFHSITSQSSDFYLIVFGEKIREELIIYSTHYYLLNMNLEY
tara:strand:+ start:124 stop:294 length:171 start_codon:yes stop_codon:yes gene_type:complete